jgi:mRNA interferase YafQ
MLKAVYERKFLKGIAKAEKRNKDLNKLKYVIELLVAEKQLPAKYRPHKLNGEFSGLWECHIEPDWLMVYRVVGEKLFLAHTGKHSDLF